MFFDFSYSEFNRSHAGSVSQQIRLEQAGFVFGGSPNVAPEPRLRKWSEFFDPGKATASPVLTFNILRTQRCKPAGAGADWNIPIRNRDVFSPEHSLPPCLSRRVWQTQGVARAGFELSAPSPCRQYEMIMAETQPTCPRLRQLLAGGAAACALFAGAPASRAEPADVRRDPVVEAVAEVMPCVVNVATERRVEASDPFQEFFLRFYGPQDSSSLGSGVIISEDGDLLTNLHVVNRATRIQVKLSDEAGGAVYNVQAGLRPNQY